MSRDSRDRIRVLHVDDDPEFSDLAAVFLEREDDRLAVDTAADANEALDRLTTGRYDCVISDYDMPGLNGIEFLEAVRETEPTLPFILFTGKGSEAVASDAISAGVTDYLQKEAGTDQYTVLANRITNAVKHDRSQRLVERSEKRLREIIDSLPHILFVVDGDGTYLLANEALASFHDTTVAALEGSDVADVLGREAAAQFRADVEAVLDSGEMTQVSAEVTDADGEVHVVEPRLLPYDFAEGDDRAVLGIAIDVTEREERERELERARERVQLALEQTRSVVFEIDFDTGDVVRHGTYREFFGHEPAAVPTWEAHCENVVHPDDRAEFRRFLRELTDGDRVRGELEYRTVPDPETGTHRWISATVDADGAPDGRAVGFARDVTERKERELHLRRKERRYAAIFDDPDILVGLLDPDGTVLDANRTALSYITADRDDVVGRPFPETPWFEGASGVNADVEAWIDRAADGEYVEFELDVPGPDDESYAVEGVFRPVTDADGEVVSIFVTSREVTDDRRRERELQRTNTVLSTLVDTLPVGVLVEDENRNVLEANHQLFDLFGMQGTPAEAVGEDCQQLASAVSTLFDDPEGFVAGIDDVVTSDEDTRDETLTLRDGRTFARNYRRLDLTDGEGHLWVYRDVSDRTRRERRLEALNETTRELMAADSADRIAETGIEAATEILGLDASSIHLSDDATGGLVPIAYSDALGDLVGEPPTFTGDGSIAWRSYDRGEPFAVRDVREDPDIYDPETSLRSELFLPLGDHGLLIAGSTTSGAFDEDDLVVGKILAGSLATALEEVSRTQELRARERELARRNEQLESFAGILSHDLRSPLNVAMGQLELAREECDSDSLPPIERSLDRMSTLIDDLLTLAREGVSVGEMESVNLGALSRTCWQTIETGDATLAVETDRTIVADRSRLRQLLENLVRNAVEHGSTGNRTIDDAVEPCSTDVHSAPAVTVTVGDLSDGFYVADDGSGIPDADRGSVFDAGYSTASGGTGLGLQIVERIADAHDWTVGVAESDDGGTRIEVTGVELGSGTVPS
jgi:PAS domain S-box-containing protein